MPRVCKIHLKVYQYDTRINSSITLHLELEVDEIGVVLDKHSDSCNVGENTSPTCSIFNDNSLHHVVRTLGRRTLYNRKPKKLVNHAIMMQNISVTRKTASHTTNEPSHAKHA